MQLKNFLMFRARDQDRDREVGGAAALLNSAGATRDQRVVQCLIKLERVDKRGGVQVLYSWRGNNRNNSKVVHERVKYGYEYGYRYRYSYMYRHEYEYGH